MIKARVKAENPGANLTSYTEIYESFSLPDVEKVFSWKETDRINIVHEALDRWANDPHKQHQKALVFEKRGQTEIFSYLDLKDRSCQWANLFTQYGIKTGDRLFLLLPPCPEIYFAILACCRLGVIFCPLYAACTLDELEVRLANAEPRAILTHPDLVEKIPVETLESVENIFLTKGPSPPFFSSGVIVTGLLEKMPTTFETVWLPARSPLYINYTSGSTGPPKGVVHSHYDMVGIFHTAKYALDLKEGTILWTDADPAWVTGTVYGTFGPWLCGAISLVQGDSFSESGVYWTLEKHGVEVWYTTPKNILRLMDKGDNLPTRYDLSSLRHIASVGAPLVPDLFYWVKQTFRHSPHDTWWMTETGRICLANFPSMDIKPGSMGKPLPGIQAAILDDQGQALPPLSIGELALKVRWPGLMSGLWKDDDHYHQYFRIPGWFLTGDIAIMDEEGYFYHQGRNDDLLKVGGDKVIGPFEIEQVLCMHPAVAEAAVISKSAEPGKGVSYLKAFIVINKNFRQSSRLSHEIKAFMRGNFSSDVIVSEIVFLENLPKTLSGKLLRRVLRAREMGLPGGDPLEMND